MLNETDAEVMIAVKDLESAKKFYLDTLRLTFVGSLSDHVVIFASGKTKINLYLSQFAGTNKATTLTWSVGHELDTIVRDLKSRGVTFEHYDLPGLTLEGDIHVAPNVRTTWFKDPDGNILSIME